MCMFLRCRMASNPCDRYLQLGSWQLSVPLKLRSLPLLQTVQLLINFEQAPRVTPQTPVYKEGVWRKRRGTCENEACVIYLVEL